MIALQSRRHGLVWIATKLLQICHINPQKTVFMDFPRLRKAPKLNLSALVCLLGTASLTFWAKELPPY